MRCSAPLFLADLEGLTALLVTLFFEEIQHLEEAGLFKGLVDRRVGVPILVTGSSSHHLGAHARVARRPCHPHPPVASVARRGLPGLEGQPRILRDRLEEERFARHLVLGGYPAVWLSQTPRTLTGPS